MGINQKRGDKMKKEVTVNDYVEVFKRDKKVLESSVGSRYAKWEDGKRKIYCPTCGDYLDENQFNDSDELPTGKKIWCKHHEIKITTVKGRIRRDKEITQGTCMEMIELNPRACEKAREIKRGVSDVYDKIKTKFTIDFNGLFIVENGTIYNF